MERSNGREKSFGQIQKEAEDELLYSMIYWSHCIVMDAAEYTPSQVRVAKDFYRMSLGCAKLRGMEPEEAIHNAHVFQREQEVRPPRALP